MRPILEVIITMRSEGVKRMWICQIVPPTWVKEDMNMINMGRLQPLAPTPVMKRMIGTLMERGLEILYQDWQLKSAGSRVNQYVLVVKKMGKIQRMVKLKLRLKVRLRKGRLPDTEEYLVTVLMVE